MQILKLEQQLRFKQFLNSCIIIYTQNKPNNYVNIQHQILARINQQQEDIQLALDSKEYEE